MNDLIEQPEVIDLPQSGDLQRLGGNAVQRVQGRYTTAVAVQVRRKLTTVESAAMQEAQLLGSDAYYGWGNGKDRVEGPSKELAMALVRCYGNCAVDMGDVQENADAWIFTASFIDLETGFTMTRQFRQSKKWTVFGKFDEARKEDIRFQIGQSKAIRNVILNALPGWLVRRALDKAKGGVREMIEKAIAGKGLETVQKAAMDRLKSLSVDEARALQAMGRKTVAAITLEDLVVLHGSIAAIDAGAEMAEDLFPAVKAEPSGPGLAESLKAKAEASRGANGNGKPADAEPAKADEPAPAAAKTEARTEPTDSGNGGAPTPAEATKIGLVEALMSQQGCTADKAEKKLASFSKNLLKKSIDDLAPEDVKRLQKHIADGDIVVPK